MLDVKKFWVYKVVVWVKVFFPILLVFKNARIYRIIYITYTKCPRSRATMYVYFSKWYLQKMLYKLWDTLYKICIGLFMILTMDDEASLQGPLFIGASVSFCMCCIIDTSAGENYVFCPMRTNKCFPDFLFL